VENNKNNKKYFLIKQFFVAIMLLVLTFSTGCISKEKLRASFGDGDDLSTGNSPNSTTLTIECSTIAADLLEAIIKELSSEYEIDMTVDESSIALENVLEGNVDIAIYDNLDTDKSNPESAVILTEDGLLVIVNRDNPEDNIQPDELTDLITDQMDGFGSDTLAQLYLPEDSSVNWNRLLSLFQIESYSDNFELMEVSVPPTATILGSDDEIVKQVARNNDALGIVGADTDISNVKTLFIDSFGPDDDEYPAKLQLRLLAKDPDSEFAKAIMEYLQSESAKKILSECGFTSVK